jgi:hypothetical protein
MNSKLPGAKKEIGAGERRDEKVVSRPHRLLSEDGCEDQDVARDADEDHGDVESERKVEDNLGDAERNMAILLISYYEAGRR